LRTKPQLKTDCDIKDARKALTELFDSAGMDCEGKALKVNANNYIGTSFFVREFRPAGLIGTEERATTTRLIETEDLKLAIKNVGFDTTLTKEGSTKETAVSYDAGLRKVCNLKYFRLARMVMAPLYVLCQLSN
jgi:hypothetical protein